MAARGHTDSIVQTPAQTCPAKDLLRPPANGHGVGGIAKAEPETAGQVPRSYPGNHAGPDRQAARRWPPARPSPMPMKIYRKDLSPRFSSRLSFGRMAANPRSDHFH